MQSLHYFNNNNLSPHSSGSSNIVGGGDYDDIGACQEAEDAFCVGFTVEKEGGSVHETFKRLESEIKKCMERKFQVIFHKNSKSHESISNLNEVEKIIYKNFRFYLLFSNLSGQVVLNRLMYYPDIKFAIRPIKIIPNKFTKNPTYEEALLFNKPFDYGYLSLNSSGGGGNGSGSNPSLSEKRFLLIDKLDPELSCLPILGVWISAERFSTKEEQKQYFWAVIMEYIRNPSIKTKISVNYEKSGILFTLEKSQKITPYLFQIVEDNPKWKFKTSVEKYGSGSGGKLPLSEEFCFSADQEIIFEEDKEESDMESVQQYRAGSGDGSGVSNNDSNSNWLYEGGGNNFGKNNGTGSGFSSSSANNHNEKEHQRRQQHQAQRQQSNNYEASSSPTTNNNTNLDNISVRSNNNSHLHSQTADERDIEIKMLKKEVEFYKSRCEMLEKTIMSAGVGSMGYNPQIGFNHHQQQQQQQLLQQMYALQQQQQNPQSQSQIQQMLINLMTTMTQSQQLNNGNGMNNFINQQQPLPQPQPQNKLLLSTSNVSNPNIMNSPHHQQQHNNFFLNESDLYGPTSESRYSESVVEEPLSNVPEPVMSKKFSFNKKKTYEEEEDDNEYDQQNQQENEYNNEDQIQNIEESNYNENNKTEKQNNQKRNKQIEEEIENYKNNDNDDYELNELKKRQPNPKDITTKTFHVAAKSLIVDYKNMSSFDNEKEGKYRNNIIKNNNNSDNYDDQNDDDELEETTRFPSFESAAVMEAEEDSEIFCSSGRSPEFKRFNSSSMKEDSAKAANVSAKQLYELDEDSNDEYMMKANSNMIMMNNMNTHDFSFDRKNEDLLMSSRGKDKLGGMMSDEKNKAIDDIILKKKNVEEKRVPLLPPRTSEIIKGATTSKKIDNSTNPNMSNENLRKLREKYEGAEAKTESKPQNKQQNTTEFSSLEIVQNNSNYDDRNEKRMLPNNDQKMTEMQQEEKNKTTPNRKTPNPSTSPSHSRIQYQKAPLSDDSDSDEEIKNISTKYKKRS